LGLYPGYGLDSVERLRRHVYSVFAAFVIVAIIGLEFGNEGMPLYQLGLVFLGLLTAAPLVRYIAMKRLRSAGLWGRPVIILTYRGAGARILSLLEDEWGQGYRPVALFDSNLVPAGAVIEESSYQQTLVDAVRYGREHRVDTIFFAMPYTRREQLASMASQASENFRHVLIVPNLNGITNSAVIARDFAGTFAVEVKHNLLDPWAQRLKRTLDLLGAGIGGLLISPLLLAIIISIKLDSPGPVFYGHQRLGAHNKTFRCWKFRTMYADAESMLTDWLRNDPELRAEWEQNHKLRNDPRVTRVGRFLRKTSLDELPQLWNVLRGEMSLVGPRPIVEAEVPKYEEAYELYCRIRPGMSGFWQVSGRSDTDYGERVEMDRYFVRNWSMWLDIIILARTVKTVLLSKGAY
jgi:Undecaprenyl-phosphate galactose phosphotransferase WbaP